MENEERFFREIEDTLHAHEDAYVPGAWEDFQKERKRKPVLLWLTLSGAAAILLVFFMVKLFNQTSTNNDPNLATVKKHQPQTEQLAKHEPTPTPAVVPGQTSSDTNATVANNKNNIAKTNIINKRVAGPRGVSPSATPPANKAPQPVTGNIYPDNAAAIASANTADKTGDTYQPGNNVTNTDSAADKPATGAVPDRVIVKTEPKKYTGNSNRSVYDSLVKAKTGNPIASVAKVNEKSLSYSVVLSPSLGNQKVNFGTGVEVNYKINKNFFISSGLAYSSLTANAGGVNGSDASKHIQGVNLAVSGLEVPLGLQYRTSGGFYLSAGVLAMSVMNNTLQYNYVTESTVTVSSFSSTGVTQQALRVVSEQKTEQSPEKINNYLGFYMFSIGKKKAIGKNQLNFGPFIRVPFGGVSSQNIQLMQGGIHLGLDF